MKKPLRRRRRRLDAAQQRSEHLGEFLPQAVDLSQRDVVEAMDKLAAAVRLIDAAVYEYSWGRARIPNLMP